MEITNGYAITGLVLGFSALVIWGLRKKKALERGGLEAMKAEYGDALRLFDDKAMYYGLESKGAIQTHEQGGTFVITDDRVRFKSWDYGGTAFGVKVNFDFDIPFTRLKDASLNNKFVGMGPGQRMGGRGLLVLRFVDADGNEDALGLLVKQRLDQALEMLQQSTAPAPEQALEGGKT